MLALAPVAVVAQEFSPRAYWPVPVGTKLLINGYSYSSGDVLLDPTIPIYGVDSRINTAFLGYMQTFSLAGRNANLVLEAPSSWGETRRDCGRSLPWSSCREIRFQHRCAHAFW